MEEPTTVPLQRNSGHRVLVWGTILGVVSAVGYTATNIFLRSVAHCDPMWVSFVKAGPTALFLAPWIVLQGGRGFPKGASLALLILTALLGQLGGNVLFQWSLGVLGISLTVPICMGCIILAGAILGRAVLNEPITPRMLLSMGVLIAAIWLLSRDVGGGMVTGATLSPKLL
jgi:drug/metabolite transporter (DMT)-like permease